MKTIKKIVLGLLLMMFASMAQAYKIEIHSDWQAVFLPETLSNNSNVKIIVNNRSVALGSLGNDIVIKYVIAQSGVLGYGVDSIAQGAWDQSIGTDGAWRIPISANKDSGVIYGLIDTNGRVYRLDTHSYAVQVVSTDPNITNVTQDEMSGAVSYRYKGVAKARPTIEYSDFLLKVNMRTSIFYGGKGKCLTSGQIHHFEYRLVGGYPYANLYKTTPGVDDPRKGNLAAYFPVPRGVMGTLWVITQDGGEYEFNSATWTNGPDTFMALRINK